MSGKHDDALTRRSWFLTALLVYSSIKTPIVSLETPSTQKEQWDCFAVQRLSEMVSSVNEALPPSFRCLELRV